MKPAEPATMRTRPSAVSAQSPMVPLDSAGGSPISGAAAVRTCPGLSGLAYHQAQRRSSGDAQVRLSRAP